MKEKVCLALDNLETLEDVKSLVSELKDYVGMYKIGKGSFTKFGPEVVNLIHSIGGEVFLDLKYHDIPNTVKDAAYSATKLGVYMFNVHASGGSEMIKAAREGITEAVEKFNLRKPELISVTVLTSINQDIMNDELRVTGSVEEQVLHLAKLSYDNGADGIVCSAADLDFVKDKLPSNFMYVTPGVKGLVTDAGSDQKRVFTPGNAIRAGSTILVIGRAITNAEDRVKAAQEVLGDMK